MGAHQENTNRSDTPQSSTAHRIASNRQPHEYNYDDNKCFDGFGDSFSRIGYVGTAVCSDTLGTAVSWSAACLHHGP
jgi:hypothetical protein